MMKDSKYGIVVNVDYFLKEGEAGGAFDTHGTD
jgi:hypothetical protein